MLAELLPSTIVNKHDLYPTD